MTRFMELTTQNGGHRFIVNFDNVLSIIRLSDGRAKIYYVREGFSDEVREQYDDILNQMSADELKRRANGTV